MSTKESFHLKIMDNAIDNSEVQAILDISQFSITQYCIQLVNGACVTQDRLKGHNIKPPISPVNGVSIMSSVEKSDRDISGVHLT